MQPSAPLGRALAATALLALASLAVAPADAGLPGTSSPYTCQFTDFNPIPPGNVPPTAGCPVLLRTGNTITFENHDTEAGLGACSYIAAGIPTCWNHLLLEHYPPGSATPVLDINTCLRANFAGPVAAVDDFPLGAGLGAAGKVVTAGPTGTLYLWKFSFPYVGPAATTACVAGSASTTEPEKSVGAAPVVGATGPLPSPTGGVCSNLHPPRITIPGCGDPSQPFPVGPVPQHPDCTSVWAIVQEPQEHYVSICDTPDGIYVCVGTITWGDAGHHTGSFNELCAGTWGNCIAVWNGSGKIDSQQTPPYTYFRNVVTLGNQPAQVCIEPQT